MLAVPINRRRSDLAAFALMSFLVATSTPLAARDACPQTSAPARDVWLPPYYSDKQGTTVSAENARQHQLATAPLQTYLRMLVEATDIAVRSSTSADAICPLGWLVNWAKGDALLGSMSSRQAEYERIFYLAGISLAYLKLRPLADAQSREVIEEWLKRAVDATGSIYDDPRRNRGNIWYWMGLAYGAVGHGTDNPVHWDKARAIMRKAASEITSNGTLPLELARQGRALHYHAWSATALVTLAELARFRNEDWYGFANGSLHKLVFLTSSGLKNPAVFQKLTGYPQIKAALNDAGWLTIYTKRFPQKAATIIQASSPKNIWLGGDANLLVESLNRPIGFRQ